MREETSQDGRQGEALLVSAADGMEAAMLEARLQSAGIPVLCKHRESGGYLDIYMGMSRFGVDLYVPADRLEEARDLLDGGPEAVEPGEEPVLMEVPEESGDDAGGQWNVLWLMRRRWRGALLLLFFVPGVIWVTVVAVRTILGR